MHHFLLSCVREKQTETKMTGYFCFQSDFVDRFWNAPVSKRRPELFIELPKLDGGLNWNVSPITGNRNGATRLSFDFGGWPKLKSGIAFGEPNGIWSLLLVVVMFDDKPSSFEEFTELLKEKPVVCKEDRNDVDASLIFENWLELKFASGNDDNVPNLIVELESAELFPINGDPWTNARDGCFDVQPLEFIVDTDAKVEISKWICRKINLNIRFDDW